MFCRSVMAGFPTLGFPTLPYSAFGERGTCEGWFVPCVSSAMRGARCCLKAAGIGSSNPALWLKGK